MSPIPHHPEDQHRQLQPRGKKPRQGRVHRNPALVTRQPLETIPHGTTALLALDHRRFLTARQISRLFYRGDAESIVDPGSRTLALAAADRQVNRRTLGPLKDLDLITVVRPFLRGEMTPLTRKEVVLLTTQGAEVVRQLYDAQGHGRQVRWQRSWKQIDGTNQAHASLLSDWYILVRRAMPDGWRLQGWRDDRDLAQLTRQGETRLAEMIPDAIFVLTYRDSQGKVRHLPFFLELDLGTETVIASGRSTRDWTAKIERYLPYLATRMRLDPLWAGISEMPRVLTLTSSDARLHNLIKATQLAGGDDRFWFTTLDRLTGDREPRQAFWGVPWRLTGTSSAGTLGEALGVSPASFGLSHTSSDR